MVECWKTHSKEAKIVLENSLFLFMVKGWKTDSNKKDKDEKHIILIDD